MTYTPTHINILPGASEPDLLPVALDKVNANFDAIAQEINGDIPGLIDEMFDNINIYIDADLLAINFEPTHYVRTLTPSTSDIAQLGSHLKGIDTALATKTETGHGAAAHSGAIGTASQISDWAEAVQVLH